MRRFLSTKIRILKGFLNRRLQERIFGHWPEMVLIVGWTLNLDEESNVETNIENWTKTLMSIITPGTLEELTGVDIVGLVQGEEYFSYNVRKILESIHKIGKTSPQQRVQYSIKNKQELLTGEGIIDKALNDISSILRSNIRKEFKGTQIDHRLIDIIIIPAIPEDIGR